MPGQNDYLLRVKLEADKADFERKLRQVEKQLGDIGGAGGKGTAAIQRGFKDAASQASNFVSILTGNKLTGATSQITSFSSALGSIPGPAGLAIGSVVGVTAAAVAGTAALFGLTKAASDYGSKIHDISQQTGLGAETISSLKIAAEQSGASIEQFASGLARFEKQVGKSKDGLKEFGITPQDALNNLDGSLAKVFKRIADAKPGFEQTTLAQKAFGKSGADLIPMIMQFDGDLPGLIAHMKELGITMTDADAAAADDFGDQMTELEAQLAAVGRQIGMELMPVFKEFATDLSDWLVENKDSISSWGTTMADVLTGVAAYWRDAATAIREFKAESRAFDQSPFGGGTNWSKAGLYALNPLLGLAYSAAERGDEVRNAPGTMSWFGGSEDDWKKRMPKIRPSGGHDFGGGGSGIHRAPRESDAAFRQFFEDLGFHVNRTFGKAINQGSPHTFGGAADLSVKGKTITDIFTLMAKSIEKGYRVVDERRPVAGIKSTGPNIHVENAKTTLRKASIIQGMGFSPEEFAYLQQLDQERLGKATGKGGFDKFVDDRKKLQEKADQEFLDEAEQMLADWIKAEDQAAQDILSIRGEEANLAEEILKTQLRQGTIDEVEYVERIGQLKIDNLLEQRDIVADQIATHERIIELQRLDLAIATARAKKENDVADAIERQREAFEQAQKSEKKNQRPGTMKKRAGYPEGASQWDKLLMDVGDSQAKVAGIEAMRTAFEGLAQAIGYAVEAWVLYGSVGESARQVTAKIIAAIAQQATVKAVFELAEGFAALARGVFGNPAGFAEAAWHFKSAAVYGTVAAVTAGIGRAVAGDSMKGGARSGGSGGGGGGSGSGGQTQPEPFSRTSPDAFISGRRGGPYNQVLRDIATVLSKFEPARPGDVLMRGMEQRPGAVANQVGNDISRNAGLGRRILSKSGVT